MVVAVPRNDKLFHAPMAAPLSGDLHEEVFFLHRRSRIRGGRAMPRCVLSFENEKETGSRSLKGLVLTWHPSREVETEDEGQEEKWTERESKSK